MTTRRFTNGTGWLRKTAYGSAVVLSLVGCHGASWNARHAASSGIRAIWVTRWDFKSPTDIATVMENVRNAGFNTVLFQVRGNGTTFYRSRIEPWADELGGRDPGFDPLAIAVREGHRRGLSVHAWVNVMPGWRGDHPPSNPRQLYNAHPDWFLRDAAGRRQPLGWYVSLNPCLPEVRSYLLGVMNEIVSRYPVDGLHLDYIRFPNERSKAYTGWVAVPDYPRDARTLALFRRTTGTTPDQSPQQWGQWRTDQVTRLVRDIRSMMRRVRPAAALSVAVGADPDRYRRQHFQDVKAWIAGGLIDAAFPMNYAADSATFERRLRLWSAMRTRIPIVMGIKLDKRDGQTAAHQLNRAVASHGHVAAFAYSSLFARLDRQGQPITDEQTAERIERRRIVVPHLRQLAGTRLKSSRLTGMR